VDQSASPSALRLRGAFFGRWSSCRLWLPRRPASSLACRWCRWGGCDRFRCSGQQQDRGCGHQQQGRHGPGSRGAASESRGADHRQEASPRPPPGELGPLGQDNHRGDQVDQGADSGFNHGGPIGLDGPLDGGVHFWFWCWPTGAAQGFAGWLGMVCRITPTLES